MSPVRWVRTINLLGANAVLARRHRLPPQPWSSGVLRSRPLLFFKFITYSEDCYSEKFKLLFVFQTLASVSAAAITHVVFKSLLFYLVKFQTSRFDLTGALSVGVSLKARRKNNPVRQKCPRSYPAVPPALLRSRLRSAPNWCAQFPLVLMSLGPPRQMFQQR